MMDSEGDKEIPVDTTITGYPGTDWQADKPEPIKPNRHSRRRLQAILRKESKEKLKLKNKTGSNI